MPNWLHNAVFYEIYPQSFQDTNGDGIGDFQGIIDHLDDIADLGCNALWLNPCFSSPFRDAGYDVSDYCLAAPRYGTNQDLKRLFEQAHRRNMHVLLDLVPGHTSLEHKWFQQSMRTQLNAYTGRYIWTDSVWRTEEPIRNINSYLKGICQRDASCAVNFFSIQPALNYGFAKPDKPWQSAMDSPEALATRQAIKDVMAFWLDMGCDGFRVDMAASLIKGDGCEEGIRQLWQDFRAFLDERYPQAALISEWGDPGAALNAGFHMDFLLHFGPSHYLDLFRTEQPYFSRKGQGDIRAFVDTYRQYQRQTRGKGYICIPSGNHDMVRMRHFLDEEEMKIAFVFLLTMPGAPFVYYGDEIGMRYLENVPSVEGGFYRTGSRTPMQWDHTLNAGFSAAKADQLLHPLDPDVQRPTVADQRADAHSLRSEIQRLITLRLAHPALLADGTVDFVYAEANAYPFAYIREAEGERLLVCLNPSGQAVCCPLPFTGALLYTLGETTVLEEGRLSMPAASAAVFQLNS